MSSEENPVVTWTVADDAQQRQFVPGGGVELHCILPERAVAVQAGDLRRSCLAARGPRAYDRAAADVGTPPCETLARSPQSSPSLS
jgi:hypothetical protein